MHTVHSCTLKSSTIEICCHDIAKVAESSIKHNQIVNNNLLITFKLKSDYRNYVNSSHDIKYLIIPE